MFGNVFPGDERSADYFLGIDPDGQTYWRHQGERHRQHRRSLVALAVAAAIFVVLALVAYAPFAWCVVALLPFVALEWWQARRTRPTGTIPDGRPRPTVDVPLDTDRDRST